MSRNLFSFSLSFLSTSFKRLSDSSSSVIRRRIRTIARSFSALSSSAIAFSLFANRNHDFPLLLQGKTGKRDIPGVSRLFPCGNPGLHPDFLRIPMCASEVNARRGGKERNKSHPRVL
jgi:hypothetical protein